MRAHSQGIQIQQNVPLATKISVSQTFQDIREPVEEGDRKERSDPQENTRLRGDHVTYAEIYMLKQTCPDTKEHARPEGRLISSGDDSLERRRRRPKHTLPEAQQARKK